MSVAAPLSPTLEPASTRVPRSPRSTMSRTPPAGFTPLSHTSSSGSLSSLPFQSLATSPPNTSRPSPLPQSSPRSLSRSAPTSPLTRPQYYPPGIAPLSTISGIDLGRAMVAVGQMSPEQRAAAVLRLSPETQYRSIRKSPEQAFRPLLSSTLAGPSNQQLPQLQQPHQQLHQPQPLQAPQQVPFPIGPGGVGTSVSVGAAGAGPIPIPLRRRRRSRSRSRSRNRSHSRPSSSSEDTETEVDSDSTFVPGRVRHQHSRSQPDLSALRGWADGVMRQQMEEKRVKEAASANLVRRRSQGRKTPPARTSVLAHSAPIQSTWSSSAAFSQGPDGTPLRLASPRSQPSLLGLRHVSPRQSTVNIPQQLTPITSPSELSSSSEDSPRWYRDPQGGMTGSEDADDDLGSTDSPSSGSLTFSPKRLNRGLRQRQRSMGDDPSRSSSNLGLKTERAASGEGLGLSLDPYMSGDEPKLRNEMINPAAIEAILRRSSLLSLRLLAVVPSVWGIAVLIHAFVNGGLWHDVWPWGVDFSREALERLVQGFHGYEGTWRPVHRGDVLLAIAWAICTAHFCFCLTTGLTHRWRSYYSLPSTITRLVSLQCLCWPATYLTLWVLGARRPLLAWVVIGVTTGWSRTVQMWVTSNVTLDDIASSSVAVTSGGGASGSGTGGDVTPGPSRRVVSPLPLPPRSPPEHVRGWDAFTYGRTWDWDAIAREVGWKVGALLLVTTAWLFWRIEEGWEPL